MGNCNFGADPAEGRCKVFVHLTLYPTDEGQAKQVPEEN